MQISVIPVSIRRFVLFIALLLPMACSTSEEQASAPAEVSGMTAEAPVEGARTPVAGEKQADEALRRATRLATRVDRTRTQSKPINLPARPTVGRTPPPGGMDAFQDFKGRRIGLIHTANVIGEVDPCG